MLYIAVAVIIMGFIMQYFLIFGAPQDNHVLLFLLKTAASLCFAVSGVMVYIVLGGGTVTRLIIIGLICGMFGDIFLHLRFVIFKTFCILVGIFAFLAGHIAYISAMLCSSLLWYVGLIFTIIVLPFVIKYILSHDCSFGKLLPLGIIYMAVEVLFAGFALARLTVQFSASSLVFFLGSLFFVYSDIMWILQNFAVEKKSSYRILCLLPYYLAQNLFVISLML